MENLMSTIKDVLSKYGIWIGLGVLILFFTPWGKKMMGKGKRKTRRARRKAKVIVVRGRNRMRRGYRSMRRRY